MTENKLKDLLSRLQQELDKTDQVDEETLRLVRGLDEDIHRLTEGSADPGEIDNVVERAQAMEARFAVEHPVADSFMREIIDALAKVGI